MKLSVRKTILRDVSRLLPLLFVTVCLAQQVNEESKKIVDTAVNTHKGWGEKANTPGAKLELREVRRGGSGGKLFVLYEMYAAGTPRDQLYDIFSLTLLGTQPTETSSLVTVGPEGQVCIADELKHCATPVQFGFQPAKGEPFRLALISADGKYKAFVSVVPNPISGEDKGCQITVTRLSPGFEIALVEGRGFPANSELAWQSNSSGESLSAKINR